MTRPIALSGFMGAGKTTVGSRVAREMGRTFVDLDAEIESAFATSIPRIFERHGEPAFRAMEARLLRQALSRSDRVIALGGGAVLDEGSRDVLLRHAAWVHLDVSFDELRSRVERASEPLSRPLWGDPAKARALWAARRDVYAQAPLHVDGGGSPALVAAAIRAVVASGRAAPGTTSKPAVREIQVAVPGAPYSVRIGSQLDAEIETVGREIGDGPIALLTDWNVGPLHADAVARLLALSGRRIERVVLPAGEARKRVGPVVDVVERLLDRGWQRSAPVVALGGGVLGDMAGLVAALTLRGVPFVQLPTTLLAMVDSSVGGKVGVDHREGKNLIGAFHQPVAVVADLAFLHTLPERELRAGFGEVVKSALLGDPELLELLEARPDDALSAEPELLADIIARCVAFKAEVVAEDARESGRRRILNFGHTLGHALEAATGWTELRHGEAVAIGMVAAAHLSVDRLGAPADLPARIADLSESLGLPTVAPAVSADRVLRAMLGDKKRVRDDIAWVLLRDVGDPEIVPVSTRDLRDMLRLLGDRGILSVLE